MSNLISGKEAWIAKSENKDIEWCLHGLGWSELTKSEFMAWDTSRFLGDTKYNFRLKPRTITLNGIEVPAPFEPKNGDDCRCYCINTSHNIGYDWYHCSNHSLGRIVWSSEGEVKQVVKALRSIFK